MFFSAYSLIKNDGNLEIILTLILSFPQVVITVRSI